MNYIFLKAHAVIPTNGTRGSQTSISWSRQRTDCLNSIHTFETTNNDRSCHHRIFHTLKEGFAAKVGIMFAQQFISQLHHLHASQP